MYRPRFFCFLLLVQTLAPRVEIIAHAPMRMLDGPLFGITAGRLNTAIRRALHHHRILFHFNSITSDQRSNDPPFFLFIFMCTLGRAGRGPLRTHPSLLSPHSCWMAAMRLKGPITSSIHQTVNFEKVPENCVGGISLVHNRSKAEVDDSKLFFSLSR